MMSCSDKIAGLQVPQREEYQKLMYYQFGFSEARHEAAIIAIKCDGLMGRMAGALDSINTDDVEVNAALGDDAIFLIKSALRMYRAMGEQQTVEEVEA